MRQCKECGGTFVGGETVCLYCGTPLVPGAKGKRSKKRPEEKTRPPNDYTDKETQRQGAQTWNFSAFGDLFQKKPADPPPIQMFASRRLDFFIAAILAFFLGTFGAHWFYLGRPSRAIWYVCFFWTGIPTIIGWVESIGLIRQAITSEF